MALTQGAPLPDITQTTTKTTEAPGYYTDYLSGLSQAGATALGKTPDQLVAGYDPLQTSGYGKFEGASQAYQPGLAAAGSTLSGAGDVTAADIQRFMNPYTQNVVDEMARLSQQNVQRNILPGLKAGAVGAGDLGSRRYAGALGQTMADIQSGLTGQQYGALSKGYTEALGAAQREAELARMASAEQARQAGLAQEYGITGAKALTGAGAERQAYEQAKLEAPLKTATNVSGLMRGQSIPLTTTEKFVGPKAGLYQPSALSTLTSIGTLVGAGTTGTAAKRISDLYRQITGAGGGISGGGGGSSDTTVIPNTAGYGEEGYGWTYYSDGTAIDPQGNYYQNDQMIWSPDWSYGEVLFGEGI